MPEDEVIRVRQIEANAARAVLAISIDPRSAAAADSVYRGEVYGPLANDRTTLPASFRVPQIRVGEEARVVVVDPSFWALDAPLDYEIVLTRQDAEGETLRRRVRLRPRTEIDSDSR
jgi:hypothetical protein